MFCKDIHFTDKYFRIKSSSIEMNGNKGHRCRPNSFIYHHWVDRTKMTLTSLDQDPRQRGAMPRDRTSGTAHRSCRAFNHNKMLKIIILVIPFVALNSIQTYNCDIIKTSPGAADTSLHTEKIMSQHETSQGSRAVTSQKENLLATLANNIELQHFRLKPIRSLVQQRPSKFDSVSEGLQDEPNEIKPFMKHSQYPPNRNQNSSPSKKSEDRMRQIMQMHEIASAHSSINHHNLQPPATETASVSSNPNERNGDLTRLQSIVKSPSQLISKALQHTKLTSIFPRLSVSLNATEQLMNLSSLVRSSSIFSGRAHNGSNLRGSIGKQATRLQSDDVQEPEEAVPQAYILAPIETDHKAQTSEEGLGTVIRKTAGNVKSPTKPNRSELDIIDNTEQRETSNMGLKNWLKMSHGKPVRNNFVQESFRDLITLSQLPIMSNNPASTAPSVYEKGGKFWLDDKQIGARGNRTRTIDDLVRFIYLLSTSSRRKRDPLEAMSPQPSNLMTTFVNQATNSLRKRPHNRPYTDRKLTHWIRGNGNPFFMKDASPRGVMWDMATDPSLAVTVFHLLERASVALPLGKYYDTIDKSKAFIDYRCLIITDLFHKTSFLIPGSNIENVYLIS